MNRPLFASLAKAPPRIRLVAEQERKKKSPVEKGVDEGSAMPTLSSVGPLPRAGPKTPPGGLSTAALGSSSSSATVSVAPASTPKQRTGGIFDAIMAMHSMPVRSVAPKAASPKPPIAAAKKRRSSAPTSAQPPAGKRRRTEEDELELRELRGSTSLADDEPWSEDDDDDWGSVADMFDDDDVSDAE